jgi:uncharacterized protein YukE
MAVSMKYDRVEALAKALKAAADEYKACLELFNTTMDSLTTEGIVGAVTNPLQENHRMIATEMQKVSDRFADTSVDVTNAVKITRDGDKKVSSRFAR